MLDGAVDRDDRQLVVAVSESFASRVRSRLPLRNDSRASPMRRRMFIVVHRDHDAKEAAESRHGQVLPDETQGGCQL